MNKQENYSKSYSSKHSSKMIVIFIYPLHLSPPNFYSNKATWNHVLSGFLDLAIRLIAPAKAWLLPILPNSTKTSLDTQNGCGTCLGYQPLKDIKMERQELRKITMDCVENCRYNTLSLSRVVARVFSQKHSSTYVGNGSINSVSTESVYQI